MKELNEIDQFELLEEKVNSLILLIADLKKENGSLSEKVGEQEYKVNELTEEIKLLKANREKAKKRVLSLLEKIEQINP